MAEYVGIGENTYTNWKKAMYDGRKGARHINNCKYSEAERERALQAMLLHPDLSAAEVQARYLDEEGIYLGSVRFLYRLLEEHQYNRRRGSGNNKGDERPVERKPLVATAPNQVFVWDITYLYKTNPQGEYYYLYAIMDLYSRKMVHHEVHEVQSAELAASFIETAMKKTGIKKDKHGKLKLDGKAIELHSDNGAPMRGSTMIAKCCELGISCTFNRPRHSNDNAHAEASFKLLKHGHEVVIPSSFDTLDEARQWVAEYYDWYNHVHRHSSICFITPQQCYEGKGETIMQHRNQIIEEFFQEHSKQRSLNEATGKIIHWEMPKQVEVMPFYIRRSKIKDRIRAAKLDS